MTGPAVPQPTQGTPLPNSATLAAPVVPGAPTGQPAAPAAPSATGATPDTPTTPPDGAAVPDWMRDPEQVAKVVAELRDEAFKNRQGKETAAQQAAEEAARKAQEEMTERFAVMLGLKPDPAAGLTPADVESKYKKDVDEAKAFGHRKAVELAVYRNAAAAGADADAVLDSAGFLKAVGEVDPEDAQAIQAAIKEAVSKNRRLAATPTPAAPPAPTPGASGTDLSGGPGEASTLDQQIAEAQKAGDTRLVISLKRQKAYQPQS